MAKKIKIINFGQKIQDKHMPKNFDISLKSYLVVDQQQT